MAESKVVRPRLALALAIPAFVLGLVLILYYVPPTTGWRRGTLIGFSLGAAVAGIVFYWKYRSLSGKGLAFLGAMAGSFLLNLFFLVSGTIVARYSELLGNHQGYAIGFLGAALLFGGIFTWNLRHGNRSAAGK